MKKGLLAICVLLVISAGVFFAMKMTGSHSGHIHKVVSKQTYYCPMHPNYISDRPGNCPICGMTLVLKKEVRSQESEVSRRGEVFISPEKQQLIGVKTDTVKFINLQKTIRAKGIVEYDERRIFDVNTKFEGWIEKLFVNYTGQFVNKGEPLFSIYSPELVSVQQEYLLALKSKEIGKTSEIIEIKVSSQGLVDAARRKLNLWDITDEQIKRLEETGEITRALTVYSPYSGFVTEKMITEGMKIMQGMSLFKIADLSQVWITADIYEQDIPLVKLGQKASIILLANKVLPGKIGYIYPYLESELRTAKVRIEVDNKDFGLKPNMYVDIGVKVDLGRRLTLPDSSLIDTGQKQLVVLARGDGHFKPVEVKVGLLVEGTYEVLEGVKEGDEIVVNANFLIDSESRMKEAMEGMTQETEGGHQH